MALTEQVASRLVGVQDDHRLSSEIQRDDRPYNVLFEGPRRLRKIEHTILSFPFGKHKPRTAPKLEYISKNRKATRAGRPVFGLVVETMKILEYNSQGEQFQQIVNVECRKMRHVQEANVDRDHSQWTIWECLLIGWSCGSWLLSICELSSIRKCWKH